MSKRVYELAKMLDMESKQLLEKLNAMGIEAKSIVLYQILMLKQ